MNHALLFGKLPEEAPENRLAVSPFYRTFCEWFCGNFSPAATVMQASKHNGAD